MDYCVLLTLNYRQGRYDSTPHTFLLEKNHMYARYIGHIRLLLGEDLFASINTRW